MSRCTLTHVACTTILLATRVLVDGGVLAKTPAGYDIQEGAGGRFERIEHPDGSTTRFEYDNRGRLVRVADSVAGDILCEYEDDAIVMVRYPHDVAFYFQYDLSQRITSITYPNGTVVYYEHTDADNISRIRSDVGETTCVYDSLGYLRQVTDAAQGSYTFLYDQLGYLEGIRYPSGETVAQNRGSLAWNERGQIDRIETPLGNAHQTYDPQGRLAQKADIHHVKTVFGYRDLQALTPLYAASPYVYTEFSEDGNLAFSIDMDGLKTIPQWQGKSYLDTLSDPIMGADTAGVRLQSADLWAGVNRPAELALEGGRTHGFCTHIEAGSTTGRELGMAFKAFFKPMSLQERRELNQSLTPELRNLQGVFRATSGIATSFALGSMKLIAQQPAGKLAMSALIPLATEPFFEMSAPPAGGRWLRRAGLASTNVISSGLSSMATGALGGAAAFASAPAWVPIAAGALAGAGAGFGLKWGYETLTRPGNPLERWTTNRIANFRQHLGYMSTAIAELKVGRGLLPRSVYNSGQASIREWQIANPPPPIPPLQRLGGIDLTTTVELILDENNRCQATDAVLTRVTGDGREPPISVQTSPTEHAASLPIVQAPSTPAGLARASVSGSPTTSPSLSSLPTAERQHALLPGALVLSDTDAVLESPDGRHCDIRRHYASNFTARTEFGHAWSLTPYVLQVDWASVVGAPRDIAVWDLLRGRRYTYQSAPVSISTEFGQLTAYRSPEPGAPVLAEAEAVGHFALYDQEGNVFLYSEDGRIEEIAMPIGSMRFGYVVGRLVSISMPWGESITPILTSQDVITSLEYQGQLLVSYTYLGHDADLVACRTRAEVQRMYSVDANHRVLRAVQSSPGGTTSMEVEYDALGRPISQTEGPEGRVTIRYDDESRIVHVQREAGLTTQYRYDDLFRLTTVIDPDHRARVFQYDAMGGLIQTGEGQFNPATSGIALERVVTY